MKRLSSKTNSDQSYADAQPGTPMLLQRLSPKDLRPLKITKIRSGCRRRMLLIFLGLATLSSIAVAQSESDRINLYFGDWHSATAHKTHGALEERDILTKGDGVKPTQKGAVLRFINRYSYATLPAGASTGQARLDGQQEIYFVVSGNGTATAGDQKIDLHRNIALLVPAGLPFTIQNHATEPLEMYLICEPTPPGFRPNSSMLVRDEGALPFSSTDGHWSHLVKTLFVTQDGLATLESVLTVVLDPLTIGQPHLHRTEYTDIEEVWSALDGVSIAFVGNQLRQQTPGMAFLHIPDNQTPHTNLNPSEDEQVRFLYFARYRSHDVRK